jgi:predicted RNA-binding Zn-ribbon protein involved in translation (DUF1610 family)
MIVVLRPHPSYVRGIAVVLGLVIVVGVANTLVLATHRSPGALIAALLTMPFAYLLIRLREISLAVDETRVTLTDLFRSRSWRRDQLTGIRWVPGWRTSLSYAFVRGDGSVAFKTDAGAWRVSEIKELAHKLGVPLQLREADQQPKFSCPACGYPGLQQSPQRDGVASHEICPSCGFEFGVTDTVEGTSYAAWRERWVQAGMPWWAKHAGQDSPAGWDPGEQVKSIPAG